MRKSSASPLWLRPAAFSAPLAGWPAEDERLARGSPLASRSATRVSARSTLTSTCFLNVFQSFGVGRRRTCIVRARTGDARGARVADGGPGEEEPRGGPAGGRRVRFGVAYSAKRYELLAELLDDHVASGAGRGPSLLVRRVPGHRPIEAGPRPAWS